MIVEPVVSVVLDGRTWDQYPAPSPATTRPLEA